MLIYDLPLNFACDLIGHWCDIRGGALVPAEKEIDPRVLLPSLNHVGIITPKIRRS